MEHVGALVFGLTLVAATWLGDQVRTFLAAVRGDPILLAIFAVLFVRAVIRGQIERVESQIVELRALLMRGGSPVEY